MQTEPLPHDFVGLAVVVLLLGVKHGFDADHLATIDGLTRAAATIRPHWSRACGALFSLGHGAVVVAVALTIASAAVSWRVPAWLDTFGAWVSIAFLIVIGPLNIGSVARTPVGQVVVPTGVRQRMLQRMFGRTVPSGHPLWAVPIGALFAVSFDTMSQAAMFSTAASRTGARQGALLCALLFTTGMLLTDGANGLWIARLLRRSGSTALIASRVMGLGVGIASLLVAVLGVLHRISDDAGRWLDDQGALLAIAIPVSALSAFLIALRLARGRCTTAVSMSEQTPPHG